MELNMTTIRALLMIWIAGLASLALAQSGPPPRLTAADAKNHIGEQATVCGKVVDTKTAKYGLSGHGKPVTFDLDQPEPNPVFYFLAFGSESGGPQEAVAAYQGKRVCVTGKINTVPAGGAPFILAGDRSQIKTEAGDK
jgi:hypothetical protein